ncbi:MAG: ATP-binding protein [Nitrospirota bacterium]
MVRMTKETHLCHCLILTSDCLFIEEIYGNARLEGRTDYFLVDDLDKERAFEVSKRMGFNEVERIWDYIGGKIGDMIRLEAKRRIIHSEKEALKEILKDEVMRIEMMFGKIEIIKPKIVISDIEIEIKIEDIKETIFALLGDKKITQRDLKKDALRFLIEENILFLNPQTGIVGFQGRLIEKAAKMVEKRW